MKRNNRDRIQRKAIKLFLQKGYNATSISDICKAAKVNPPTLYYYYKDKRHLFFSCHMKSIEEVLKPYLMKAEGIEDPNERLVYMIDEYTKVVCSNPELRILIHETLSMTDENFDLVRAEWGRHYLLLKESISQLQSRGAAKMSIKPSWAALLLLGAMTWITFWFDYKRQNEASGLAEAVRELALDGILGKPAKLKKSGKSKKVH